MQRDMKRVLVVLQILTAGALLALPLAKVRGQSKESTPTKPGISFNVEILNPSEGVDFAFFLNHLMLVVRRNWYVSMPESAMLGEKGRFVLRIEVQKDGTLPGKTPTIEVSSGKKSLDRAAADAIRSSAPFKHLPEAFRGPNIELRLTFLYNLPPAPIQHP